MTKSNGKAHRYNPEADDRKYEGLKDKIALERMVMLLKPRSDESALDVGTGKGNAALKLAPLVREVTAIDYAPGTEVIFQNVPSGNCRYLRFDLTDGKLPVEDTSMNIVVCRAALHHIKSKPTFFEEAFRVLRPGGRLFIMDPVMSPSLRFAWSIISKVAEQDYQAYCTREELADFTVRSGFKQISEERFPFKRWMDDWINAKITEVDQRGKEVLGPFAKYVRKTIKTIVTEDFPRELQTELNLRQEDEKWVFDYDCRELLLTKALEHAAGP